MDPWCSWAAVPEALSNVVDSSLYKALFLERGLRHRSGEVNLCVARCFKVHILQGCTWNLQLNSSDPAAADAMAAESAAAEDV